MTPPSDRRAEWFVPTVGPLRFRIAVGLLFLPYTSMVLGFTVIGGMLAPVVHLDRVAALLWIYFWGLGVAAHALDAIGSTVDTIGNQRVKPWGEHFSKRQLYGVALLALVAAYGVGLYYILFVSPWLGAIALLEGFFLFAYNLEWFGGRCHTDGGFAFSWGVLPTLAGYILQTNRISAAAIVISVAMGAISLIEINASRPYKEMKRRGETDPVVFRLEVLLKCVSGGVILLAIGMALWRAGG